MLAALMLSAVCSMSRAAVVPPRSLFQPAMYYGKDHRRDLYEIQDARLLDIADSAVAVFDAADVSLDGGQARLKTKSYGKQYKLCRSEKFYGQREGADCSGTLIAPDLVLTAGHCVKSQRACVKTKFVFGFALTQPDRDATRVPAGEVYGCGRLLDRQDQAEGADWAVVRLDRAVTGHRPARLRYAPPRLGAGLVMAGFPSGLPLKLAAGARVTDTSDRRYYQADLDAFAGNSGSGVFLEETGELVGVMVRGPDPDFVRRGSCRVTYRCRGGVERCGSQDVTRLTEILVPPALRPSFAQDVSSRLPPPGSLFGSPR